MFKKSKEDKQLFSEDPIRITFEVKGPNIVFSANGQKFMMGEKEITNLINMFVHVDAKAQLMMPTNSEARPEKPPENFGIKECAKVGRLLKKGLSMDQVAGVMGIQEAVIRKFFRSPVFPENQLIEEIKKQAEVEDYCLEAQRKDEFTRVALRQGVVFVSVRDVVRILKSGRDAAAVLRLDPGDYKRWEKINMPYLNSCKPNEISSDKRAGSSGDYGIARTANIHAGNSSPARSI